MFNKRKYSESILVTNIIYLTKEEIRKIFKSKGFYVVCFLLMINIFNQIELNLNILGIPQNGGNTYISFLFNSHEVTILFSFFIIINLIKNKKFIKCPTQFDKKQIFLSKIISMYLVILFVEIVFIVFKVLINSIQFGFEIENINVVILAMILKLIFILAIITILITSMLIIKNNVIGIIIFILIINCGGIASFLGNLIGVSINLNRFSIINYFNIIALNNIDKSFLFKGIILGSTYIVISIGIGIYFFKNYTFKVTNINLIGHKHELLANIKFLIDISTYVHNEIFLKYEDNEREKKIVLDELKEIVKMLTEELEQYKNKEIKILELNKRYCVCISKYRKINKEYPWVATFGLYAGYGFNYYKYFKSML